MGNQEKRAVPPAAGRRLLNQARCLVLTDRHALYVCAQSSASRETARIILADWAEGYLHAALRRSGETGFSTGGSFRQVSVSLGDMAFSFRVGPESGEAYGHAYGFGSADGPMLFDVVLARPQVGGSHVKEPVSQYPADSREWERLAGLAGEGRAISRGREYLFPPAGSLGMMEYGAKTAPGGNRVTRLDAAGWLGGEAVWLSVRANAAEPENQPHNALFRNGILRRIGAVSLKEQDGTKAKGAAPWSIRDAEGQLALAFTPLLEYREKPKLFGIKPPFRLLFGALSGSLGTESRDSQPLSTLSGCLVIG